MLQRKDKRIFVGAMVAVLFLALAAGIAISIQPASAQAPMAIPGGAPRTNSQALTSHKFVPGAKNGQQAAAPSNRPGSSVVTLQGRVSQPASSSAGVRAE